MQAAVCQEAKLPVSAILLSSPHPKETTQPLEGICLWMRSASTPKLLVGETGYTKVPFDARPAFSVPRGFRDRCSGQKGWFWGSDSLRKGTIQKPIGSMAQVIFFNVQR